MLETLITFFFTIQSEWGNFLFMRQLTSHDGVSSRVTAKASQRIHSLRKEESKKKQKIENKFLKFSSSPR